MVKKTLCLNMIVKNESHIIEETLTNIIEQMELDYWVISDTGSTDNTQKIIKDFFKNKNIPGELFEDEWKDFGHNRSVALAHAYNKTDYLFIFDADDKIIGNLVIDKEKINIERYDLTLGNEFTYVRPLLITNRKRWKYEGVLHEYLSPMESIVSTQILAGDYYVESRRLGARSSFQDKYEKDAAILTKAFEEEKKEGLKNRYAFYAAQSYKDCNQTDKAIEWYLKVLNLNNWNQEKYHSCLMMGILFLKKNDFENALKFLTLSHKYDHERLEGIILAMELCFKKDMHSLVHSFYQTYKNAKVNLVQKLFVTTTYYNNHIDFYNSISAFYINEHESGYQSIKNVIHSEKIEESKKLLTLNNLRFYQPILLKDKNLTTDFFYKVNEIIKKRGEKYSLNNEEIKYWEIIFQNVRKNLTKYQLYKFKNKKQPKIFLSFTTCKRLDLFGQTINSILNQWLDKDQIDYWFCVDDNSSEEDRNYMKRLYPWIDYYMKDEEEKGHKKSMNIIFNKLKELQPTYWIHMEDDFLFFEQNHYIKKSIQGIEQLKEHNVKQVLFNREYGEVISDYNIVSHKQISGQSDYCLHDYDANKKSIKPNCYYWPIYSFRPSLIDVKTILELGDFDTEETFFERTYALKWVRSGYQSAFFNKLTHIHIGRLTSERMSKDKKNAYELNETNQFSTQKKVKNILIINLKHRKDRKEIMTKKLEPLSLNNNNYQFVEAINGYELEPSQELYNIFKGLDVGYRKGVIGCALTHIRLWEQLLKDPNNDYYLILEDDCIFRQDFKKQIENMQEEMKKQELIFLGYSMFSQKREEHKQLYNNDNDQLEIKELNKDLYIGATFCYSINKIGALKLIQYIKENGVNHGIDYQMKITPGLNIKEIQPQIVFSNWNENGKEIDTDIQNNSETIDFSQFKVNDVLLKEKFVFIQGMDQIGNDVVNSNHTNDINKNMKICLENDELVGFNTLGFLKNNITKLEPSKYFKQTDGIYIKKQIDSSIYIGGCVKNCASYLEKVFQNIINIVSLFKDYQIIIAYDDSNDDSLKILEKYQKKLKLVIIKNNNNSKYSVENICNSRNSILKFIIDDNKKYDYFIMIDMDDVCSKPINTNLLIKHMKENNEWDALSFNRKDYYDIWALSIDYYLLSCWHFDVDDKNKIIENTRDYIKKKLNNSKTLVSCKSAFNGLCIYKTNKFINCTYDINLEQNLKYLSKEEIKNNENKLNAKFNKKSWICEFDCEHRSFHLEAITKNNARIKISPYYLFNEEFDNIIEDCSSEKYCDYVSSRGILKSCEIKSNLPKSGNSLIEHYNFQNLKDGSVVYVCCDGLKNLIEKIKNLKNYIILVSGDSDWTIPGDIFSNKLEFDNFINSEYIIHWFSQNLIEKHDKITHIPIGMDYHTMTTKINHNWGNYASPLKQEYILKNIKIKSKPYYQREVKCYSNFHFLLNTRYGQDRKDAVEQLNKDLVYYEKSFINRKDSWINQSNYSFVISPHGNGYDCHRTWEGLLLGCIPVIKTSKIDNLFDELPVLIVNEWKNITQELLNKTLQKFKEKNFNYEKLTLKYWIDKIYKYKEYIYNKNNIIRDNKKRIKILCNWTSSEELLQEWKPIIKQQSKYQIEFTTSNENIDYFIIINKPQYESDSYEPEKTIVYQMEPWVHNNNKNWGMKTWGIWAKPDKNKFIHVHSHDEYLNNVSGISICH